MATQENFCPLDPPCVWVSLRRRWLNLGFSEWEMVWLSIKCQPHIWYDCQQFNYKQEKQKSPQPRKKPRVFHFFKKLSSCLRHTSKCEDHWCSAPNSQGFAEHLWVLPLVSPPDVLFGMQCGTLASGLTRSFLAILEDSSWPLLATKSED